MNQSQEKVEEIEKMEDSRARLLEHMFRRCWAMYFIIMIILNVPLSLLNIVAVFLIFKLGNSSYSEGQSPSLPLFSFQVQLNPNVANPENSENPENPENLNENPENPNFHPDVNTSESPVPDFWTPNFPHCDNCDTDIAPRYTGYYEDHPDECKDSINICQKCLCQINIIHSCSQELKSSSS